MTTVYLDGEGQRVSVVEERQGEEAVNPWASMSPEADPPGRGGEERQATYHAPGQSAQEEWFPERERPSHGPAPGTPPPAATVTHGRANAPRLLVVIIGIRSGA